MKTILQILILICILTQCTQPLEPEVAISTWEKVKNANTAEEISIFIQENPTTDHFWEAFYRYCFLIDSLKNFGGCYRTNAEVVAADTNLFLFNGERCDADSLTQFAYQYLISDRPTAASQKLRTINGKDSARVSMGYFEFALYNLQYDTIGMQHAVIAVSKGITLYKDHLSNAFYKQRYNELNDSIRPKIDQLLGGKIWFYDFEGKERYIFPTERENSEYH